LSNRQKELQHLAYLKSQSELMMTQAQKKQKEEELTLMEREAALQASQVQLQKAELLLKDADLRRQTIFRYFYISLIGLLALLSFFVFKNYRNQRRSNAIIQVEKKKSDDLLLNILPEEIAQELKETGAAKAKLYENVTILFTDFVGFTQVAEQLTPEQLVNELHQCFKAFDEIVGRHGLEKIKTIGDAYMAVSGLPVSTSDHARRAAAAALEMQEFMKQRNQSRKDQTHSLRVRIGLHSGSVIAGIVGTKKFAFDIWGDAVNLASRMESSGEPGKTNISGATYALLHQHYTCTYRGKIEAKNKGQVDMYFLD
jgi:class 3 adenylate cyclase